MKRTVILTLILLSTPLVALSASQNEIRGYIDGNGYVAEYPSTKITGYYIPNGTGDTWITQKAKNNQYECVQGGSYCCVPKDERGFYTEVQCQGTGIRNGQYYRYTQVKKAKANSVSTNSIDEATAFDTRPTPNRTIAVNLNSDSKCYIPLGARVYIDSDDQYEGVYVAEDTGAAFEGSGTTNDGQCKIDIYMGEGDDKYQQTLDVTQRDTDVYILSWPDKTAALPSADQPSANHASGTTRSEYTNEISLQEPQTMWNIAEETLNKLKNQCGPKPYDQKSDCIKTTLNQISDSHAEHVVQPTCTSQSNQQPNSVFTREYIAGKILSASEISYTDNKASRTFIVPEDPEPVAVPLQIRRDNVRKLASIQAGEFIKITGGQSTTAPNLRTQTILTPTYEPISLSQYDVKISRLGDRQKTVRSFLQRAADCQTATSLCVCNVTHPKTHLTFLNDTTTHGTPFEADGVPYNFDIINASHIDTKVNKQKIEAVIDNPVAFKDNLRQKLRSKKVNKTFQSPATGTAYLLHDDDRLGFLEEKPEWYEPAQTQGKLVSRYTDMLDQKFSPQDVAKLFTTLSTGGITTTAIRQAVQNRISKSGNQQPMVESCRPAKYHQTVCIRQNRTTPTSQVKKIRQQTMSLPPLQFTVQI